MSTHLSTEPVAKPRKRAAKKVSQMRACGCFDAANMKLRERNAQLDYKQTMDFSTGQEGERLFLPTVKVDDRKKLGVKVVWLNFCPFCGVRYED